MRRAVTRPVVCLVTSGAARQDGDRAASELVTLAGGASAAGVDMVQIREPHVADGGLLTIVGRVLGAVDRSRTAVLVNDRIDVAIAAGADGVHLRGDAMPASRVRAIAPEGFWIGRSVHSADEAREAEQDGGADYLIFGTVFPSASKPEGHRAAGVPALAEVCAAVRLPVLAIGGITGERAAEAAAAGSAGVAAIGMFAAADREGEGGPVKLVELVRRVRRAFDTR